MDTVQHDVQVMKFTEINNRHDLIKFYLMNIYEQSTCEKSNFTTDGGTFYFFDVVVGVTVPAEGFGVVVLVVLVIEL